MEIETTVIEVLDNTANNPAFKIHNNLNSIPLEGFTAVQLDLFMGICHIMQDKEDKEEHISFKRIREESGYKSSSNERLLKDLEKMRLRLRELNYASIETEDFEGDVALFSVFAKSKKVEDAWVVGVNKYATYLLNNLTKQWTIIHIREFTSLKSKYSKLLYKQLMQWRSEGIYITTQENLRNALDIPEKYETKQMNSKILKPSVEELSKYFPGLKCIPADSERQGSKGRPVMKRYTLLFEPEINKEEVVDAEYEVTKDNICPNCDQPLVYRKLTENGDYCWCHADGYKKNAKCSKIWRSKEEIEHAWKTRKKREDCKKGKDNTADITQKQLKDYYDHIREEGKKEQEKRISDIRALIPEIGECLDEQTDLTQKMVSILPGKGSKEERARLKERREAVERKKVQLLKAAGYPADYLERQYRCPICEDTGYTKEGTVCSCAKDRADEALEWLKNNI